MIEQIRHRLKHYELPPGDANHRGRDRAAVLIPLIIDDPVRILLSERAGSLQSHGGEVAFPGGREDHDDGSSQVTALRETEEEVGIGRGKVELIGELRPFVSKYGLLVTPVVGVLGVDIIYRPSADEIASLFEVPLSFFQEAEPIRVDDITRHGESHWVPAWDYEGYEIWGLTSLIIQEFLEVTGIYSAE